MILKNYRWYLVSLVAIGVMFNALGRSTLSVAAPTLFQDLGINERQYSFILGAFQAAYTVSQPICGYILDVVGLKLGYVIMIVIWSATNLMHVFVPGWYGLAFLRGIVGLVEGATYPAAIKTSSEWFPALERGIAGAIASIGPSLGAILAPLLVLWAIQTHGWRMAFLVIGIGGFIFAAAWWFLFDTPEKSRIASAEEVAHIRGGQERHLAGDGRKPSWATILGQKNFWGIALSRFLADPTWGIINFWFPLYLVNVRHLPLTELAMLVWLPYVAGDLGSLAGGALNGIIMRTTRLTTVNSRRVGFSLGAILMLPLALVGYVESAYVAVAIISLCFFAHQMLVTQATLMSTDLFKRSEVSTVTGLVGMIGWTGIFSCTLILGALVKSIGYEPFFVILSVLDIGGAILLWTLVKERATESLR